MHLSLKTQVNEIRSSNPQIWNQDDKAKPVIGGVILIHFYVMVKGSIVRLRGLWHTVNVRSFSDM